MSDMTLYELDKALQRVLDGYMVVDEETGEIVFDDSNLDELQMAIEKKVEGCIYALENQQATIDVLGARIKQLQERKRALEARRDNLERYVAEHMASKVELPELTVSTARTKHVEIVDEERIPSEYMRAKTTENPDKAAIRKAIESGQYVPGAALVEEIGLRRRRR